MVLDCGIGYVAPPDLRLVGRLSNCLVFKHVFLFSSQLCFSLFYSFVFQLFTFLFVFIIAAICSPPCLLFSNLTDIVALDYKTSAAHSVVSGLKRAVAIDVHFSLGYIFWSDVWERNIKRSGIDGSGTTIIISNIGVCDGLAVEWRTSKLYWTDTTHDTISVSDLAGKNPRKLLSSGLYKPRDIALDPDNG